MEKNKLSFQLNADDFLPAGEDEKKSLVEDVRLDDGTSDIDTLDAFEYTFERDISRFIRYE